MTKAELVKALECAEFDNDALSRDLEYREDVCENLRDTIKELEKLIGELEIKTETIESSFTMYRKSLTLATSLQPINGAAMMQKKLLEMERNNG